MRTYLLSFLLLSFIGIQGLQAQMQGKEGPRSFFDMLTMYAADNNMADPGEMLGAGINVGYSMGTHNMMLRGLVGFETTTNVKVSDVSDNLYYNPFGAIEGGAGIWRSNGNRCGAKKQYAFTALAKVGLRYNAGSREGNIERNVPPIESGVDYYGAVELGYFFLDSYFKNSELYIEGGYFMQSEQLYARLGFRTFLNTKAVKR